MSTAVPLADGRNAKKQQQELKKSVVRKRTDYNFLLSTQDLLRKKETN